MTHQGKVILGKISILVSNVDSGEGYACVYGKSIYLPLFYYKPKTVKKKV